ncbi:MAG: ATP synthase F1 subunit epsilon [Flavobacteriales bacterium]|nr:ATP synthase F1 subunit epsilon [Flavobacteriales bacterium]|tara:strand:+ start:128 stop:361 length:234 start_codon:yes stop_codon:yes gene_type:complete
MKLEIITPEKQLFNGEVSSVRLPGKNGEFEILKNHAPIISTLNKGEIRVISNDSTKKFEINGGVIEMQNNKIIVLAE